MNACCSLLKTCFILPARFLKFIKSIQARRIFCINSKNLIKNTPNQAFPFEVNMGKPFIITINCSKILCDGAETQFAMFIDDTKMTIVYELTEWIRWIFSLKDCIYLTYQNSVIHELEDIKVLSVLQNFEIKPCGQSKCIHKGFYNSLLNKLNLNGYWRDIKVPHIFLEKISSLEQKLSQQNQLCILDQIKPKFVRLNSQTESQEEANKRYSTDNEIPSSSENEISNVSTDKYLEECKNTKNIHSRKSFKENKLNEGSLTKYARIDVTEINVNENKNNQASPKSMKKAFKENKNELNKSHFDPSINFNFNSNLEPSSPNKSSSPLPQNKYSNLLKIQKSGSPIKELKNQNSTFESIKDENSSIDKTKKLENREFTKPFSLGQMLSHLRDECKNNNDINNENSTSTSLCPENANEMPNTSLENSFISNDTKTMEKRKRKRTRKHRSFKKQETRDYLSTLSSLEFKWNIKKSVDKTKPNHIRFKFDDNFMETNCTETIGPNTELSDDNGVNGFTASEFQETNVEDLVSMINEKRQALAGSDFQNPLIKFGDGGTKNLIQTQENYVAMKGEDCVQTTSPVKNLSPVSLNIDSGTLMQLKKKFPSPVVIERFF